MSTTPAEVAHQPVSTKATPGYLAPDVRTDAAVWDKHLCSLGGHLLQSWAWGELKRRHGWAVERVAVGQGQGRAMAQVLVRHRGPVSLGYVPRGPALGGDPEVGFRELIMAVDRVCRRHRALSLLVEPDGPLGLSGSYRRFGFVRGPAPFQPARTVKVPLLDDEALLGQMHQKTRYNVRLAQRRGVVVERRQADQDSLALFYDLLRDTSQRNQFGIHDPSYYADFMALFGERALLLFALIEGEVGAALIAARFGEEAIYMYGGSSTVHRAHGAAFLLQYEAMRWARDAGCRRYDLWGIPADDPAPSAGADGSVAGTHGDDWRGLYIFKVRFGGQVVSYPTPMERRYLPVLPALARRFARLGG